MNRLHSSRMTGWIAAAVVFGLLTAGAAAQEKDPPSKKTPGSKPPAKLGDSYPKGARPAPKAMQQPQPQRPKPPVRRSDIPEPTVQLKEGEVPGVKFDTPSYNFGRVREGQQVFHDFWFTNTGTGPLEILKVKPSCGCTTAGTHDRIVQPGKTGKIPIKLNLGRASGPVAKTVMVYTNCTGTDSMVTLRIQGEVWQPIQASPASASFGRLTADQAKDTTLERRLTIVNNTEDPVALKGVRVSNPSFKAETKVLEEGKRFELIVNVVPPLATGPVTGTIEIDTNLDGTPKVTIPVNAYVTADVDVTPNQLTLPATRQGKLQRQFFIRNNTIKPVKLSDLKASNENLKLTLVETQPVGKSYRLTVEIPEEYQVADGGDTIVFKTDNEAVPEITIPITQAPSRNDIARQFSFDASKGANANPQVVTPAAKTSGSAQADTKPQPKTPAKPQPTGQ